MKPATKTPMADERDEQFRLRQLALEIMIMLPRSPKKARRVVDLVNELLVTETPPAGRRLRPAP
jgi:hypothetical protein